MYLLYFMSDDFVTKQIAAMDDMISAHRRVYKARLHRNRPPVKKHCVRCQNIHKSSLSETWPTSDRPMDDDIYD